MSNIRYRSKALAAYFRGHRERWEDFYPSEKWVIGRVAEKTGSLGKVLDAGCASGGLGAALMARGLLTSYAGIDVNQPAVDAALARGARRRRAHRRGAQGPPTRFVCGDILEPAHFRGEKFDTVFSLSCADWNLETERIIEACWSRVVDGGYFILSLRLTDREGVNDISRSYQPIAEEKANYVVFNVSEFFSLINRLSPPVAHALAYGYWGKPSPTAVTPYRELVFAVFALRKVTPSSKASPADPSAEIHLPLSLWKKPES